MVKKLIFEKIEEYIFGILHNLAKVFYPPPILTKNPTITSEVTRYYPHKNKKC